MLKQSNGFALLVMIFGWLVSKSYCQYESYSSPGSTIGFNIHHRFSDPVKSIFPDDDYPEKGTVNYFSAMVHRDRIQGRRLASGGSNVDQTPLTNIAGNETYRISLFGYLYYANVSVGTPALDFLVALDTGSDLLWLPCDCGSNCVTGVDTPNGLIEFNIYSLNKSSTGSRVACGSTMCPFNSCTGVPAGTCPYQIAYLSENTSSTGYIVEDVMHLTTDVNPSTPVDANIAFGCGLVQTGIFLTGAAPNGLLGLGLNNMSVPNMLANQNIVANSFTMCFSTNGIGKISFGDQGSEDQSVTPLLLNTSLPTYDVTITQISVGTNVSTDINAEVIFDSGTSFTYLHDPAYSFIAENFNSKTKGKRTATEFNETFEYCYDLSSCQSDDRDIPSINLTMKDGAIYHVIDPTIIVQYSQSKCVYCLGLGKSDHPVDIIGENFMTGYRIAFNQEKMVLGWKESDCNYVLDSSSSSAMSPGTSQTSDPEAAARPTDGASSSGASKLTLAHGSPAGTLILLCCIFISILIQSLAIH